MLSNFSVYCDSLKVSDLREQLADQTKKNDELSAAFLLQKQIIDTIKENNQIEKDNNFLEGITAYQQQKKNVRILRKKL